MYCVLLCDLYIENTKTMSEPPTMCQPAENHRQHSDLAYNSLPLQLRSQYHIAYHAAYQQTSYNADSSMLMTPVTYYLHVHSNTNTIAHTSKSIRIIDSVPFITPATQHTPIHLQDSYHTQHTHHVTLPYKNKQCTFTLACASLQHNPHHTLPSLPTMHTQSSPK